jgi:N-carbamoylputrescine amidase
MLFMCWMLPNKSKESFMPRTLHVAAVQMEAVAAPTTERLSRAANLVRQAAQAGAQLVLLPELFNTGYVYSDDNHPRAERLDGPTATWMRDTAAQLGVHLGGSLMLLDGAEVYNALLLFAPDGRMWRYNKNYPWGWERGYFREKKGIAIARTDLGDLGMLICWDTAHPNLWRQYAGQVDLLLISSCPPDVSNPTFRFPSGAAFTFQDMGVLMQDMKGQAERLFGDMVNQQTAWLGVPAVCTSASGCVETRVPNPVLSWLGYSLAGLSPRMLAALPAARHMTLTCDMTPGTKILAGDGRILAELNQEQGETVVTAAVTLTDHKIRPQGAQPPALVAPLSYLASDVLLPALSIPTYRAGLRRAWGGHMAPLDSATRQGFMVLGGLGILWLLYRLIRGK